MKTIELEFTPGENVYQMINNSPVLTEVRACAYKSYIMLKRNEDKIEKVISESTIYSTVARPNNPVPGSALGRTIEELSEKVFGTVKAPEVKLEDPKPEEHAEKVSDAENNSGKDNGDYFHEGIVNRS